MERCSQAQTQPFTGGILVPELNYSPLKANQMYADRQDYVREYIHTQKNPSANLRSTSAPQVNIVGYPTPKQWHGDLGIREWSSRHIILSETGNLGINWYGFHTHRSLSSCSTWLTSRLSLSSVKATVGNSPAQQRRQNHCVYAGVWIHECLCNRMFVVVWCGVVWCGVVCLMWYDVVWCKCARIIDPPWTASSHGKQWNASSPPRMNACILNWVQSRNEWFKQVLLLIWVV